MIGCDTQSAMALVVMGALGTILAAAGFRRLRDHHNEAVAEEKAKRAEIEEMKGQIHDLKRALGKYSTLGARPMPGLMSGFFVDTFSQLEKKFETLDSLRDLDHKRIEKLEKDLKATDALQNCLVEKTAIFFDAVEHIKEKHRPAKKG